MDGPVKVLKSVADRIKSVPSKARSIFSKGPTMGGVDERMKDQYAGFDWEYDNPNMTNSPRRAIGPYTMYSAEIAMKIPPFPKRYSDMYEMAWAEPVTRTCIKNIRMEVFRRDVKWVPAWTSKCPKCKEKYSGDVPLDRCPNCDPEPDTVYALLTDVVMGKGQLEIMEELANMNQPVTPMLYPDKKEYKVADDFFKNCNSTGQRLIDVLAECEDDVNIVDDAYLVLQKEYATDGKGNILGAKVRQILRGAPPLIRKVIDQYNRVGGRWWKCVECGKVIFADMWNRPASDSHFDPGETDRSTENPILHNNNTWPPICKCGAVTHDVIYFEMMSEFGDIEHYFIDGEVIHWQKYSPSTSYGKPPILSLYTIQAALMFQNIYIRDFFEKRKIPPGFMTVTTSNPKSFWNFWGKAMLRWKVDKQYVPVAISEVDQGGGKGGANYVKLMDTLAEMQYTEARDEMRQRICSFYGVSMLFMDDAKSSPSGAKISDGSQLIVMNRTVENTQRIYNEYVFPRILEAMGIKNWLLVCNPHEDRDVMKDLQNNQLEIQNMQMLKMLGFEVDVGPNGDWVYWKPPISQEDMMMVQQTVQAAVMPQPEPGSNSGGQSFQPSGKTPSGKGTQKQQPDAQPGVTKKSYDVNNEGGAVRSEITPCGDGRWHWVVYGIEGYVYDEGYADSEEEALLLVEHHIEDYYEEKGLRSLKTMTMPDWPIGEPVTKAEGSSQPFQMGGTRALGRTQTPLSQKPGMSGSAYTPGAGGEKMHRCHICGQNFTSKQALGGHMKSAHGEEQGYETSGVPKEQKQENLALVLMDLLVFLNRMHRPTGRIVSSKSSQSK